MPTAKTQRILFLVGTSGVLFSCLGCGLLANNKWLAGQIALVLAWLLLVPLFGYLISTRRRLKKVAKRREVRQQEELSALASLGSSVNAPGEPDHPLHPNQP